MLLASSKKGKLVFSYNPFVQIFPVGSSIASYKQSLQLTQNNKKSDSTLAAYTVGKLKDHHGWDLQSSSDCLELHPQFFFKPINLNC